MDAGGLIKRARLRAGLNQAQLAERAGTSQPVISAYERGLRQPGVDTLARLVAASGAVLRLDAAPAANDLVPPLDIDEHARRLADVLSLADAIASRRRSALLKGPRMVSRTR